VGIKIPFVHPSVIRLSGGRADAAARVYLSDEDVPIIFELRARENGTWGNSIAVSVRQAGPARFDVTIRYPGARFENARQIVLYGRVLKPDEPPLPALTSAAAAAGTVGVLQAKASGVLASVTRSHGRPFTTAVRR
jgi:hypothetical protein